MCEVVGCSDVVDPALVKQHNIDAHGFPSCGVCQREIKYCGAWLTHVNRCIQRNKESLKPCPIDNCGEMITLFNKQQHCSIKHGYPTCSGCSRSVRGVENWLKHVKSCITIIDTTSMRCSLDQCDVMITTLTRKEHFRMVHFYPACQTCPQSITGPQNWLNHITSCNDRASASVHCALCNETMVSHLYDDHCVNYHLYPRCEVPTCPATFTTRFNHATHVLVCMQKSVRKCPYASNNCAFTGTLEAVLQHLDLVHSEHLRPGVRANKARNMLSCSSCYKNEFGNLYTFGLHLAKCVVTAPPAVVVENSQDHLSLSSQVVPESAAVVECPQFETITPSVFLFECKRPFYATVHGVVYTRKIMCASEWIVNPLALADSFQPDVWANSGTCASLFIANIAFESPALSLLPVDDLARTRFAIHLACQPVEYIWILFVSQLLRHTHSKTSFLDTLRTAVIPPGLLLFFSEENLRDAEFLNRERLDAYDTAHEYGQTLVYQAADGERPLHELMVNVGYAAGKYSQGPERVLHRGILPVPDATNMHAVMKKRSEFNSSREIVQTSAVYEFFKSFGALYCETFGSFFAKHHDGVASEVGKPRTHYTMDHMCRTFDAFEAIKVLRCENLPRDIGCLGRNSTFLEVMWMELQRVHGHLSGTDTRWLFSAPFISPQQRDYSIKPACLMDDPRFVQPAEVLKKRKLLL